MNLRKIREARGVRQIDVCRNVGLSQSFYCLIETGVRRPSVEKAKRIAAYLEFDWTQFYEDEKENPA